jgi:hypothetical protein
VPKASAGLANGAPLFPVTLALCPPRHVAAVAAVLVLAAAALGGPTAGSLKAPPRVSGSGLGSGPRTAARRVGDRCRVAAGGPGTRGRSAVEPGGRIGGHDACRGARRVRGGAAATGSPPRSGLARRRLVGGCGDAALWAGLGRRGRAHHGRVRRPPRRAPRWRRRRRTAAPRAGRPGPPLGRASGLPAAGAARFHHLPRRRCRPAAARRRDQRTVHTRRTACRERRAAAVRLLAQPRARSGAGASDRL